MSDGAIAGNSNSGINDGRIYRQSIKGRPVNHVPPRTLNRRPNFINNDIGPAPVHGPSPAQTTPIAPIHSPVKPTITQPISAPLPLKAPAHNMPLSAIATQSAVSSPIPTINTPQPPIQHRPTQHQMTQPISSQPPQNQHLPPVFKQEPVSKSSKSKRRFSPAQLTLVGLGCAVFAVGLLTSLNTMKTNNEAQAQLKALTKNTAKTESKKATAVLGASTKSATSNNDVATAPDEPKSLIIPQIQLNGIVEPIGLTATGSMAAPSNPSNVGWYKKSAKPGEVPTVMIMNGSVGTAAKPGAFALLSKLAVNATFQVIRGDGKTYNYIVVKVESFDPASPDSGKLLVPSKPGVPTLDLVTTGSTANGNENTQGTIVYAEQQG